MTSEVALATRLALEMHGVFLKLRFRMRSGFCLQKAGCV